MNGHCLTCNYQNQPLFYPGCICQVVNKHEYAKLNLEIDQLRSSLERARDDAAQWENFADFLQDH